jgi:YD repeat-containing protein
MSVTIGGITFDRVRYDRGADVLYLHVGDPRTAVDFDASPEGHALRYDAAGRLVGVTIVNAKWLLEHEGRITITLPAPQLQADSRELAPALGLAS